VSLEIVFSIAFVVAYLMVGFILEMTSSGTSFDARTLLLWPFGLDIRLQSWFELRRIKREGARCIAEAVKKRDTNLRLVDLQWTGKGDEAIIKMTYGYKNLTYRGTCTVWNRVPDGDRAASWLERWLCDRWMAARWDLQSKGYEGDTR
jgi:hypothetical protein